MPYVDVDLTPIIVISIILLVALAIFAWCKIRQCGRASSSWLSKRKEQREERKMQQAQARAASRAADMRRDVACQTQEMALPPPPERIGSTNQPRGASAAKSLTPAIMKYLEIRRHSIRTAPEQHLNQSGVSLARSVGNFMGPFQYVLTSTLPRAYETAIAMGFAVNAQNETLNTFGEESMAEASWPGSFAHYAEVVKKNPDGPTSLYVQKLAGIYRNIMENHVGEGGSGLVINHGGVLEMSVVGCLPFIDYSRWGGDLSYCEGVRLVWEEGEFVNGEVLPPLTQPKP
ncbi:hypothetical protein HDV05_003964 [Chytridiales sp. JEL 0842]|nr:hypothetical protein HDV05_003964 [Chytridiales sp. JEL 0842]